MQAQAKVRSMTQRLGWTTKPASVRLMISTGRGAAAATRGPAGPLVSGVGEDALEEREAPGDPIEDQRRAIAILDAGGVDLDTQHQAEGVGDEVPLAALNPLPASYPTISRASALVFTLWLSMIAAVGLSSRPSRDSVAQR